MHPMKASLVSIYVCVYTHVENSGNSFFKYYTDVQMKMDMCTCVCMCAAIQGLVTPLFGNSIRSTFVLPVHCPLNSYILYD